MTQEEIIRMARESGFDSDYFDNVECSCDECNFLKKPLERFAALVAAHEREKQAEHWPPQIPPGDGAFPFECWSTNDGDSWFEHPADAQIIEDTLGSDAKVGDEYEVLAGWNSVRAKYRITAIDASNEDLADFEVECVSHPQNDTAPVQQAEQEPIGNISLWHNHGHQNHNVEYYGTLPDGLHQLYTHSVRTKDLTDGEILAVARGIGIVFDESDKEQQIDDIQVFARAVIAKYKEKNK